MKLTVSGVIESPLVAAMNVRLLFKAFFDVKGDVSEVSCPCSVDVPGIGESVEGERDRAIDVLQLSEPNIAQIGPDKVGPLAVAVSNELHRRRGGIRPGEICLGHLVLVAGGSIIVPYVSGITENQDLIVRSDVQAFNEQTG